MTVAAILLAGGESSRMGEPKPLLEWGPLRPRPGQASTGLTTTGPTLIEYQLAQLKSPPVDQVVVVLGHKAQEVLPYVHAAGGLAVVNELYAHGRASSLRIGAAALSEDVSCVVVLNVDQPRPREVVARLVEEHQRTGNLITIPTHEGQRGHPPVLDGSLLPELREVKEESQGLRAVIHRHRDGIREVPFETSTVLLDLNRPEEYEAARASYFSPGGRASAR